MRTRTTRPETRRRGTSPARRKHRTSEDRVRQAGGPEDQAYYRCSCGKGFAGAVSTHVVCPSCGTDQAW